MEKLKLLITDGGGTRDATSLVQMATWAGAYNQVSRTLDFSITYSDTDNRVTKVSCALGSAVQFYLNEALLFDGYVFSRQRDTASSVVEVGCIDRGIYLKRNETSYQPKQVTPEAITRKLCGDFGVPVGELAETGIPVTRNFPGKSLYSIIQTAYTEASAQTGEMYMVRFRGDKLDVICKRPGSETLVLEAGSNLIHATVTESTESMTNQVAILDDKGNQVGVQSNTEAVELYGLMQSVLTKSRDEDPVKEAKRMLADGDVSQKITVENLGNPALIAGNCCVLREPTTGLYGLFWIDSDTHTWKNGLYQNKLILNYRNMMDEQEAGQLSKA